MKSNFSYKDIYVEDGKKVLEMNILPEKYCNFDCVFCPIGRSKNKIDEPVSFEDYSSSISELDSIIEKTQPDLVFINSKGEALVNDKVSQIIDFIKSKGLKVRLLSNGYILSKDEYINIANKWINRGRRNQTAVRIHRKSQTVCGTKGKRSGAQTDLLCPYVWVSDECEGLGETFRNPDGHRLCGDRG